MKIISSVMFASLLFFISGCSMTKPAPKPIKPAQIQTTADTGTIKLAINDLLKKYYKTGNGTNKNLLFDIHYYYTATINNTCMAYSEYSITHTVGAGDRRSETKNYDYCFIVDKNADVATIDGKFSDKDQYMRSIVDEVRPKILSELPSEIDKLQRQSVTKQAEEKKKAEAKEEQFKAAAAAEHERQQKCQSLQEELKSTDDPNKKLDIFVEIRKLKC